MASGLFSTHRPINRQHVEFYIGRATMDPSPNCMTVRQTECVLGRARGMEEEGQSELVKQKDDRNRG